MRRCLTAILAVGLVAVNTRDAAAQSDKDIAAYGALISTPIGLLSPVMVSPGTKGEKAYNTVSAQYSRFGSDGFDANAFGGSWYHQAGMNAAVSATVGYGSAADCTQDCGILLLGADIHSTLWDNSAAKSNTGLSVNLKGSFGYGKPTDANMMGLAVGVPLAMTMTQADKSRFSAFVTPGFGWGRVSVDGAGSESGTRPLIGAGASWTAPAGWGLHASFQKVVIENGGNSIGAGFSWRM